MFWWFQIKSIKIYLSFLKDRDSRVQGDLVSLLWSLTTSGSFSLIFFIFYAFREYVSNFSGHQYHLEGLWKHRFLGPAQELLLQSIWGEAQESVLPKSSPSDGDVAGPRPTLTNHLFSLLGKHCSWIQYFFLPYLVEKHHQTHKTSFGLLTLRLLSCLIVSKFTAASQLSSIVRNKKSVRGKRFGPELAPVACFKHLCTLIILPWSPAGSDRWIFAEV